MPYNPNGQAKNFQVKNGISIGANTVFDAAAVLQGPSAVKLSAAFETANAAFNKANTAGGADQFARNTANASFTTANASFLKANTVGTSTSAAFNKANSATVLAQAAFDVANTAGGGGSSQYTVNTTSNPTAPSANVVIDTFDSTEYRTAKYIIQASNESDVQSLETLIVHNDTNTKVSSGVDANTNGGLFTVAANVVGTTVNVILVPTVDSTQLLNIDLVRTTLVARLLGGLSGDMMLQTGSMDLNVGTATYDMNI